ncbi:GntR family transcriptional regulator [Oceanobacillus piezotolerans]|uniref:GntR family transcriptional regulator n=1 Tax=Oceanobacillus piezotolerans TaxID=2448030 RepID=A0A498D9J2_9BACI|nr:GntR family transcriptional regulator [Oceanobacillus piezotolerans]RLL47774.1 GntR family transcriptional regulator [Oceanobacillus piezotolerans]
MNEDLNAMKKSLGELIANALKQDIFNKNMEFGERLIEAELATRFDVSRSTIREAFMILEQEGLVTSKARKGTFVSNFTKEDMNEMLELRLIIEAKAFINALDRMEEEHYLELHSILEKMKLEADKGNWNILFDLDMEFHQFVILHCGNSRFRKLYESIQVQLRVYLAHLNQYYSSPISFYMEHVELYEALVHKDKQRVEKQIADHINYVEEKLIRQKN